jgi:hypothetical protein
LDREEGATRAAVMAPGKDDPAWKRTRPSHGLSPTFAALWAEYSADLPRLRSEAKTIEAVLKASKQT